MEGGGRGWKFGWFLRWARGMALLNNNSLFDHCCIDINMNGR